MEQTTHTIHIFGITISAWVYGPGIFVLWLILFYSLKGFLFFWIKRWGEKTKVRWDLCVVKSLHVPLNILILGGGLALLARLLPLPPELDQPAELAVKVLAIIALIFFFDSLVKQGLSNFAGRVQAINLSSSLVQGLVRLAVLSFGLLILLDSLGISITPIIASLGIGSLAVALALQGTLANLFAGIFILADRPVRVGDFIKLETAEEGYVTEVGWRNTRIRMLPNVVVIVPNDKLISSTVHNYYLPDKEMAVLIQVGVHYASDLAKVERVTIEVGKEIQKKVQGAVDNFEPFIRYHTFADSSINFTVILRVKEFVDQYLVKHEFIKALHERYKKEGIIIPFPIRTLDISTRTLEELGSQLQHKS
ncbi:MAG: mechanosensitive ion channel family protein [Candidatus Omnitrophica bacterium]|nr:mechanosensitive ion channel family protein [Candidatus Omnitrophota bacterium]